MFKYDLGVIRIMKPKQTILLILGLIAISLVVLLVVEYAGVTYQQPQSQSQQPPQQQPPTQQPSQQPATPSTKSVAIKGFAFDPVDITVKQGDTVVWTNEDPAPHTVKFDFTVSQMLNKGDTFTYTFKEKGTFEYVCGIHPFMKAKVTVI